MVQEGMLHYGQIVTGACSCTGSGRFINGRVGKVVSLWPDNGTVNVKWFPLEDRNYWFGVKREPVRCLRAVHT